MTSLIGISFWKISHGKRAYLWEEFKTKKYIAIGWNYFGGLGKFANRDKIIKEFYDVYSDRLPTPNKRAFRGWVCHRLLLRLSRI